MKRILFAALTAAALFSGGILQSLNAQNMEIPKKVSPFPVGDKLPEQFSKYFVGQAWLAPLTDDKRLNAPVSNVTFSPGCRNNWHSHTGGQLLIAVGGRGYYQEKGRPARALLPGDIVEIGTADEIYYDPRHPYTWALLSSMPQMGVKGEDLFSIPGTPPNLFAEIHGDAFAPRNQQALKIDFVKRPPYFAVSPTHKARTWLLDPRAPRIEPPAAVKKLQKEGL